MKEVLLTINHVYLLVGATIYVGVLTTLRLFLYPGWDRLRPENMHDQFSAPIALAVRFFVIAIPTWMVANIILIVSEWGEPEVWLAVLAFLGLMGGSAVFWWGIRPINKEIAAGIDDPEQLTTVLRKWMKINNLRWLSVIVFWAATAAYFVAKPDLPSAIG